MLDIISSIERGFIMNLEDYIAVIEDYPKKGISFKDVTPLLASGEAYDYALNELVKIAEEYHADYIVSPEARGFLFGCPVASKLKIGFVPVRKKGKLPRETISQKYELEYGFDELFMHKDAIKKGSRVIIIDDLVAVGGTLDAVAKLVEKAGGTVVSCLSIITLLGLPGEERLKKYNLKSLLYLKD